ncbi:Similar to oligosaccharide deacetylase [Nitrospira japonica]|uniref:Similar to oligosaccharide deacetylase n=1 Tax=Nitrospira japonica TaxID=1325564 RepID=A0A1W1IBF2_9BACT|nr:Similar to oligosaccharide deacetylase [Nitrospira japonica]
MRPVITQVKAEIKKILGSLTSVVTKDRVAALTFDDGPHPEFTPQVLDVLDRHRAQATFFMVGQAAKQYPDLVRRVGEAGHAIGGHSWDHSSFRRLTGSERRRQMLACQEALAPYGSPLVRPPYGEQSLAARLDAFRLGYEVVGWSFDVGDWYELDASLMANRLVEWLQPGSVVLLHDALFDQSKPASERKHERQSHADRKFMLKALDEALKRLSGRYHFVTVPELLRRGSPYRTFWFKKFVY